MSSVADHPTRPDVSVHSYTKIVPLSEYHTVWEWNRALFVNDITSQVGLVHSSDWDNNRHGCTDTVNKGFVPEQMNIQRFIEDVLGGWNTSKNGNFGCDGVKDQYKDVMNVIVTFSMKKPKNSEIQATP